MSLKYINRELSWLDFNARVLQEASNKDVPLLERLRFIGIFSNNLDEFFQVRYATVKRIADEKASKKGNKDNILAKNLLDDITNKGLNKSNIYALVEIPKDISRFVVLPKNGDRQYIMFIDDIIRYHLHIIFSFFNYSKIEAHMLKITRDAEFDIDDIDLSKSYIKKIQEYVNKRKISNPVRLVYDKSIPGPTLDYLIRKINISSYDSLIPGGKYHHRTDFMNFPELNRSDLLYPKKKPLNIRDFEIESNLLDQISKKDYLMYTPYHSFSYLVSLLRQSAIDPSVKSIKITLYRLSRQSNVISSLINAAKNGKKVLVQIELQARFDEENNIKVSQQLKAAGVDLIFGLKGLKVHSKICLIERIENDKKILYGFVSTGNFNETTARVYSDFTLFTSNQKILKEVSKVFDFLQFSYKMHDYKHLIVSPHHTTNKIFQLIDNEIDNAKKGIYSEIILKLNSFTSYKFVDKLYEASQRGVKIKLLIRGICCLIPNKLGFSNNIEVKSVVDRYLEHSRVYVFENGGDKKQKKNWRSNSQYVISNGSCRRSHKKCLQYDKIWN